MLYHGGERTGGFIVTSRQFSVRCSRFGVGDPHSGGVSHKNRAIVRKTTSECVLARPLFDWQCSSGQKQASGSNLLHNLCNVTTTRKDTLQRARRCRSGGGGIQRYPLWSEVGVCLQSFSGDSNGAMTTRGKHVTRARTEAQCVHYSVVCWPLSTQFGHDPVQITDRQVVNLERLISMPRQRYTGTLELIRGQLVAPSLPQCEQCFSRISPPRANFKFLFHEEIGSFQVHWYFPAVSLGKLWTQAVVRGESTDLYVVYKAIGGITHQTLCNFAGERTHFLFSPKRKYSAAVVVVIVLFVLRGNTSGEILAVSEWEQASNLDDDDDDENWIEWHAWGTMPKQHAAAALQGKTFSYSLENVDFRFCSQGATKERDSSCSHWMHPRDRVPPSPTMSCALLKLNDFSCHFF